MFIIKFIKVPSYNNSSRYLLQLYRDICFTSKMILYSIHHFTILIYSTLLITFLNFDKNFTQLLYDRYSKLHYQKA